MEKLYLYVLNYCIPDIFYIDISKYTEDDIVNDRCCLEDILIEHGYNPDECSYMTCNMLITEIREDKC